MGRNKLPTLVLAAAIVAGVLLVSGVSAASLALTLILLACPLMMVFMMRGMDHGGQSSGHDASCHRAHVDDRAIESDRKTVR